MGLQVAGVALPEWIDEDDAWVLKDGLEFSCSRSGQDHSWKTAWQMLCYMTFKRDGVCREQLESNCALSNGHSLCNRFGDREFHGRVKHHQILASSNTPSQEEMFPKRSSIAIPACSLPQPSTRRAQRVQPCREKSLKAHLGSPWWAEHKVNYV